MEHIELHDVSDRGITNEFISEIALNHFNKKEYELELYASPKLIMDFHRQCDKSRFRTMASEIWEGLRISSYLTEIGLEVKLLPIDWDFLESKIGILAKHRKILVK